MRYISTRGQVDDMTFEDVLISGLAKDGGLFVPKIWPRISEDEIYSFEKQSYQDIAFKVMRPFTGDTFSNNEFRLMIETAYSSFNHSAVCPLTQLESNHFLLELFHGPTLAFKDVAMQLIGQMFENVLRKRNLRATVIAATSGDTGSAAMAAFENSNLVDVFILFPNGRVSDVQRRQMTTLGRANIHALAVDGDFDDCQALVKQMFNDYAFRDRVNLSGVNSINWARVMSQVVYYFTSAVALGAPKRIVNFTVPTGNFGDIFAAFVAKKMGLSINKLVIASNENDILHRTLKTGVYCKKGLKQTISPSMDIQVASNFERLIFEIFDRRPELVRSAMNSLTTDGKFELHGESLIKFREDFLSGSVSEDVTFDTIKYTLNEYGELVCPHTAVGLAVANNLREESHVGAMITLSTAHPAKFPESVKNIIGKTPKLPDRYDDLFSKKEVSTLMSNNLIDIKNFILERRSA